MANKGQKRNEQSKMSQTFWGVQSEFDKVLREAHIRKSRFISSHDLCMARETKNVYFSKMRINLLFLHQLNITNQDLMEYSQDIGYQGVFFLVSVKQNAASRKLCVDYLTNLSPKAFISCLYKMTLFFVVVTVKQSSIRKFAHYC